MYVRAEVVGGPWDGAYINIGHVGHMYQCMPHRPDQTAMSEFAAVYEWNGMKWYFRYTGETERVLECSGK